MTDFQINLIEAQLQEREREREREKLLEMNKNFVIFNRLQKKWIFKN